MEFKKNVSLSQNDLLKFQWSYSQKKLIIMSIIYFVIGCVFGLCTYMSRSLQFSMAALINIFGFGFLFVLIIFVIFTIISFFRAKKSFKTNAYYKEIYKYSFSDKNLTVEIGESTAVVNWDKVYMIKETKNYIYIFISNIQAYILHKNIFSQDQLSFIRGKKNVKTR